MSERLLKNFLDESRHRRAGEARTQKAEIRAEDAEIWNIKAGRWVALSFAVFCISMAVWLAFRGHTAIPLALIAIVSAPILMVLMTGKLVAPEQDEGDQHDQD